MAPTETQVERQTSEIIRFLLEDDFDSHAECRSADNHGTVECDGPEDDFDPVVIADKLRSVADALNDDPRFRAALADVKKAAAQEAVETALSHGVEVLCQAQEAEVAPEMQIIRASVAFGLYIKKSCPELKSQVQSAMRSFLTRRVGTWIVQQGGWGKVV